jgi:SAM-dependent methyltransferase
MNPTIPPTTNEAEWMPFVERYRRGEWRAPIFTDILLAETRRLGPAQSLTLLDIGCGKGFDDDKRLQEKIAAQAGRYLGVEPDENIAPNPIFHQRYACRFEEAPIDPGSVDLAFAVMVLEHLEFPDRFWSHLHHVLREGGVFWGFTIDSRHWFAKASSLTKRLGIKEWYLNWLHGNRGEERYENYPVYYRCNTPEKIQHLTQTFRSRTLLNFNRIGQLDYYFPKTIRWIGRGVDRVMLARGLPGHILAIRVEK